jgi:hypothetical protein
VTAIAERVLAGLFARLQAVTGIAGLAVERNRNVEAELGDLPLLVQLDGDDELEAETAELKLHRARPRVIGVVQGASSAAAGTALNDLLAKTRAALEADKTLGGWAMATFETACNRAIDLDDGHKPIHGFALDLDVLFATARTDPESLPA